MTDYDEDETVETHRVGPTVSLQCDTDGTPLDPFDGSRLVEVEPGKWRNPVALRAEQQMREYLERAARRLAEDARAPLEPNAPVIHPDDVEAYERHYGRGDDAQ